QEGQEINVKVLSIDQEGKRIRLSLREAGPAPEPRFDKPEDSQPAEDTGNVTLGDQFGHLFEKK
ncbi:MAG: 30S ribosomal protein S1, partial [Bacillota bacterium]|nr:30S ribosomal protein S1 [Bacillota bacterium]